LEIARKFIAGGLLSAEHLLFYAIEANKRYYEHLRIHCDEYLCLHPAMSRVTLRLLRGRYDEEVSKVQADIQGRATRDIPTFYLIDPFGVKDLPFNLLALLLSPKRNELMFNLMYEETNRFLSRPEFEPHLDATFGEPSWRSLRSTTGGDRKQLLVDYFKARLFVAGARYVQVF
jgi:three-Cys-motif partner protein